MAKLSNVLQILHCSWLNVQKLHPILSKFVFLCDPELIRRDNLFRSVAGSGLGPTQLFVSELVSRFLFLRDQCHPFFRPVIQTKLAGYLPEFVVSSDVQESLKMVGFFEGGCEVFPIFTDAFFLGLFE